MSKRTSSLPFVLALLALWPIRPVGAQDRVVAWGLAEPCQPASWSASQDGAEELREAWSFRAFGREGQVLEAELLHSNQGLDDHKAAFRVRFRSADGREATCRGALPGSSWHRRFDQTRKRVLLDMGRVKAELGLEDQQIHLDCQELKGQLHFKALAPAWQPGRGRLAISGKGGGLQLAFPSLRASVAGNLKTPVTKTNFKGWGWVRHRRQDVAFHDFWRRRLEVHGSDGQNNLHCEILDLDEDLGGSQHAWCAVSQGKALLMGSARMRWEMSDFIRDEEKGPTALIPRRLCSHIDGGLSLQPSSLQSAKICISLGRLRKREDPARHLGSLSRWASRALNTAMDYDFDCRVDVELKGKSLRPAVRKLTFDTSCRFQLNQL